MRDENRQEQIVEAAVRRMAHFGIHKTTLTEVADDLSLTKQALAYYFTDKAALVHAVLQRILRDYHTELEQDLQDTGSFRAALEVLVETRARFFLRYYVLTQELGREPTSRKEEALSLLRSSSLRELSLLEGLFQKAQQQGELQPGPARRQVRLLLEVIAALGRQAAHRCVPDEAALRGVLRRQKELLHLLYHGISLKHDGTNS